MRQSFPLLFLLGSMIVGSSGCGTAVHLLTRTQQQGDREFGLTYYIGGAGPIGNVGSLDVPGGLLDAGYKGAVEVFTWQGWTHAGDQINLARNRSKAAELAAEIKRYRKQYPEQEINIIALSAGTGIAAFALEYLPEGVQVDHAVFLGCSLSSRYDLTRALRRIRSGLYVVYSEYDPILKNVVWYTGTVDRSSAEEGIAGLEGFHLPDHKGPDTERQYAKLHSIPYRYEFYDYGYEGRHTDCTRRDFIRAFVAPVILGDDKALKGALPEENAVVHRPSRPSGHASTSQKTNKHGAATSRPGSTTQPRKAPE